MRQNSIRRVRLFDRCKRANPSDDILRNSDAFKMRGETFYRFVCEGGKSFGFG